MEKHVTCVTTFHCRKLSNIVPVFCQKLYVENIKKLQKNISQCTPRSLLKIPIPAVGHFINAAHFYGSQGEHIARVVRHLRAPQFIRLTPHVRTGQWDAGNSRKNFTTNVHMVY